HVGRENCYGHRRGIGSVDAVAGSVGERVRAVEPGRRRIGEGTVGVERERAVRRRGDQDGAKVVVVRVRVVGQHAGGGDGQGRVFQGAVAVRAGYRHRVI